MKLYFAIISTVASALLLLNVVVPSQASSYTGKQSAEINVLHFLNLSMSLKVGSTKNSTFLILTQTRKKIMYQLKVIRG